MLKSDLADFLSFYLIKYKYIFFEDFVVFLPDLETERKREEEGKKEKVTISI